MSDLPPADLAAAADAVLPTRNDPSTRNDPPPSNPAPQHPPGQLPLIYSAAAQARVNGYSWDEINDRFATARSAAVDAGYTHDDVDKAFGLSPDWAKQPAPPGLEQVHPRPDTADTIRGFAEKYLTPDQNDGPVEVHTAGDFAKMVGWSVVDMGKIIGAPVVNGIAAIMEGLDGKPRTEADNVRLGVEAQGFLGLLAGTKNAFEPTNPAKGVEALRSALPTTQDFVDSAAAVAKAHPEGITPGTLTAAARELGDNFAQTGEHPVLAAQRAVNDPEAMAKLHEQMDEPPSAANPRDALNAEAAELRAQGMADFYAGRESPAGLTERVRAVGAALSGNFGPEQEWAVEWAEQNNRPDILRALRVNAESNLDVPEVKARAEDVIRRVDEAEARMRGTTPELTPETPLLDANGAADASAEAVKQPGWIPPGGERPALEAIPANDALLGSGRADTLSSFGVGALKMPRMPEMDINPETIGQPNPRLGDGLIHDFQRIFRVQSLDPDGAGVIRSHLADNQANLIRSTENLRRFGRAIGDLSSDARRAWWHAYEAGDLEPYKGTALGSMGEQLRGELDRAYEKMNALGIAPGYIENYLPRLYQDEKGAARVFAGRAPLEGTKTFTRERVFEFLQDAEAAGKKLVTDNPAEATLIRLHDMGRYIAAHEIMNELEERGMGKWVANGRTPPEGLMRIDDKIAQRQGGFFYAPEGIATMLNRHLSPGWSGRPIYDTLRSMTSMFTSLKLMGSVFHPLYLASDAIAGAFGTGLKQAARGGFLNIGEGAVRMVKSPLAPIENLWNGRKIVRFAQTGLNATPQLQTMYDAMIQSGARFKGSDVFRSSAAGSFFDNLKGSIAPESGLATLSQELASMLRNAPDIMIGNQKIAPGYIRALAQVVPRVMDTLTDPIMGKFVPWMKAGALSRMLQEEMAAHPDMTMEDIRKIGGRMSDHIDNRIGEVVQDNLFWPTVLHNLNNVLFMAPQWFMGKLRLMGGAAEDIAKGGFVEGPGGSKELSDNVTTLVGYVAATIFTGALYGYLKGTWNKDWTLKDYVAPPTGGTDSKLGDERISLPGPFRDAYGWTHDPVHELTNKMAPVWGTLWDLGTNTQFNGAAITDPRSSWAEAKGDYGTFLLNQLAPMMVSSKPSSGPDAKLTGLEQWMGIREAPFGLREPELADKYEGRETNAKVRKKAKMDARQ